MKDQGSFIYQSQGYCQNLTVVAFQKPLMALSGGSSCWVGDELPPDSKKVGPEKCKTPCNGFPDQNCGGVNYFDFWLTGTKDSVNVQGGSSSGSTNGNSASMVTSTSNGPTPTKAAAPSTITEAGQTIVVTATGQTDNAAAAGLKNSSGPNKAAIAAGVIVGLVALLAICLGAFFFLRTRKRRAIEEEYRRNAAVSNMASGKAESHSSIGDSRLEPSVMLQRRMSDGSIADNQDYSRRILKVPTHPSLRTQVYQASAKILAGHP